MPIPLQGLTPLLQVHDMPAAIAFYTDLLGFEVVSHSPVIEAAEGRYFHWAWLRNGAAELMLNTAHDAGARPAGRDSARDEAHADTCLYLGCPDLDAVHAALSAAGLTLLPPHTAGYGMRQLYLRDPDGYALCLQWPAGSGE